MVRDLSDNGYFREKDSGVPSIGLHRPYFETGEYSKLSIDEATKAYKRLEEQLVKYLSEMGAPNSVAERMLRTKSTDVELVNAEEFKKYYARTSPYFEEWLLAKCSSGALGLDTMSENDSLYWKSIFTKKIKNGVDHFPQGADAARYERLNNIVSLNRHAKSVCRKTAMDKSRLQWANN